MKTVISKQPYKETINLLDNKLNEIDETGSFFALFMTEYDSNGNVVHDFFDIIDYALHLGYNYVNTIVAPSSDIRNDVAFYDNVLYIVWLCKNKNTMHFNKDSIREKHIWKDVEWGKRSKNYNPKGKDPGNVWIPTIDDGKANITEHILLSYEEIFKRILDMTECNDDFELYESEFNVYKANFAPLKNEIDNNLINSATATVVFNTSENMNKIDDKSVQVAVTSPPYWDLKDYFKEGQIGQEPYDDYLTRLESVWSECYNKLSYSGSLWININTRVRAGKAILIPLDIIKSCQKLGYYYKGIIIWHKSSGIPTNDKNIVDRHEYVLVFSKDSNFIVDKKVYSSFADYKNPSINGGAFWNINRKAGSVGKKFIHPAIYPTKLVERILLISSSSRDLIMDPFLGSGTSLIASLSTKRNFIGYEYNQGFKELMDSRFEAEIPQTQVDYIQSDI